MAVFNNSIIFVTVLKICNSLDTYNVLIYTAKLIKLTWLWNDIIFNTSLCIAQRIYNDVMASNFSKLIIMHLHCYILIATSSQPYTLNPQHINFSCLMHYKNYSLKDPITPYFMKNIQIKKQTCITKFKMGFRKNKVGNCN